MSKASKETREAADKAWQEVTRIIREEGTESLDKKTFKGLAEKTKKSLEIIEEMKKKRN